MCSSVCKCNRTWPYQRRVSPKRSSCGAAEDGVGSRLGPVSYNYTWHPGLACNVLEKDGLVHLELWKFVAVLIVVGF